MRDFDVWLSQFRDSISSYDYYIDFAKVVANAENHRAELHLLNSLIGRQDVESEFKELLTRYPSIISVVPILIAVREHEIYAADNETGGLYRFDRVRHSAAEYCVFMRKTGLFDLMSRHLVNKFKAWTLAALVILVWGMTFANTRALLTDFSALEILVVRFGLAWAVLLGWGCVVARSESASYCCGVSTRF